MAGGFYNTDFNSDVTPEEVPASELVISDVNSKGFHGEGNLISDTTNSDADRAEAARTGAETAETNAAASAAAASTSETNAATSEANASTSETNAAASESNASTSETNAAASEAAAAASAAEAAAILADVVTKTEIASDTGTLDINGGYF